MDKHLLSICIPTNGVARWVVPTLQNIYSLGSDENTFEVVVADNGGKESDLAEAVKEFEVHTNFRYIPTNVVGFYNIVENFTLAKGDYMIKLNHRCILHRGMIEYIIKQAEYYYERKPLIFFSNNKVGIGKVCEYKSFDEFLYNLSYNSSLSQGLFFWKEDLLRINQISFAPMSPNVSLMFDSRNKDLFILDDTTICHEQDSKGKYGYDLFNTFAVLYLDLVNEVRIENSISKKTFMKIKNDIRRMLGDYYFYIKVMRKYNSFSLEGAKESMNVYYSSFDYYYIVFYAYTIKLLKVIKDRLLKWKR